VTGPDLLESGSARRPSRTARRRYVGLAAALALAAGVIVLAARADPAPPAARPAPAPAAPLVTRHPRYLLYDVAVAGGRVYALAGSCVTSCGYRLLTLAGGRWASTPMTVPAAAVSPGRLLVTGTGNRFLAVLDGTEPGAYVSTDGGRSFTSRSGRPGAPIDTVPAGLVPELGAGGAGVFDPVAGRWRPLLHQPMRDVLSVAAAGPVVYAAARAGTALVVATSRDAGRSWTSTTVTNVRYKTPELQLVLSDGRAYLVVTRPLPAGEPGVATVWRDGPAWTRVLDYSRATTSTPKFTSAVGEPNGGILLADGTSGGVLAYDTGRSVNFYAPPGETGDPPLIPSLLRRDTGGTVAAITADGWHLLVRQDTDVGWMNVPLPS
jgi:hypothetical protein